MENLAQNFVCELNRNREILKEYQDFGQPTYLWRIYDTIQAKIFRAEAAQGNGDVIEMLKAFKELEKTKEKVRKKSYPVDGTSSLLGTENKNGG